MDSRKQIIARTALKLFADRGFDSTSTQLIAKDAQVSEALIFKHFTSKVQLLEYLIKSGYKRIIEQNRGRLQENDPLLFVHKIIELPFGLVREEPDFWKMQSRLVDMTLSNQQHERFLQPITPLLEKAFRQLGYSQPEQEAALLLLLVEGIWKHQVTQAEPASPALIDFIKSKYSWQ